MKKILAVSIVSAFIFAVLWILKLFDVTRNLLILNLVGAGLFLIGAWVLKILSPKMGTSRFFCIKPINLLETRLTLCLSVILICGSFLINYATSLFYAYISVDAPSAFSADGYSSPLIAILCVIVLPPLVEEIFFRGAVMTMLRTAKLKPVAVVGASAFLFMVLHGPGWYFLSDLFAGILLGMLVYLTGSVYSSIAAHFLSNLISYILAHYGERLVDAGIGDLTVHVIVICLVGAVCHLLHLLKKLILLRDKEDRSRINENSRRWEEQKTKGEQK